MYAYLNNSILTQLFLTRIGKLTQFELHAVLAITAIPHKTTGADGSAPINKKKGTQNERKRKQERSPDFQLQLV